METVLRLRDIILVRGEHRILDGLSWTVTAGQHWVLMGPNGSGKTALLNVLTGYLWPTHGQVEVLGERFGETDLRQLRRRLGWVSIGLVEQYARYHGELSALQVVMSGAEASIGIYRELGPEVRDRAREVLDRLGAGTLEHRAFSVLSQGERQRVVLARAWLAQPEILILDEPTTALDMVAREALLTGLTRLVEDSKTPPTVIYVTHAVDEVLPWFSHVLLLRQGKVVAQGEKAKVLADDPLRRAFELSVQLVWRDGRPFVTLGSYAERSAVPANQK